MSRLTKLDALVALRPTASWVYNDGEIVWEDDTQIEPTEEELNTKLAELREQEPLNNLREVRNRILAQSDWMANSDVTMSDEWRTYRQALRDITETYTSIEDVVWPTKPE